MNQSDLIKYVHKIKPDYISFDNIQEIAKNSNEFISFAKKIPESTTIVQVTGSPLNGYQKLTALAQANGIWDKSGGKPNAQQSASLNAQLTFLGVGYKLVAFEDEIKINISKTRNSGKGGWSAPRYERNMRISVNNVKNAMLDYLKEFNIEYDLFNYARSFVIVIHLGNSSYVKFRNILTQAKKISNDLAFAHVSKIPKSSLEYIPLTGQAPTRKLSKSIDSLIVGVDPGTTTGLAIISAKDGRLQALFSAREFSTSQIIRKISSYGKAVMICADVNYPPPYAVQKLSRILGAQIYAPPKRSTPRVEKRSIVQDYLDNITYKTRTDNHSRDALFSAIKGFNSIKPKIEKIESLLKDKPELKPEIGKIINITLSGIAIYDAITFVETEITNKLLKERLTPVEGQTNNKITQDILITTKRQSIQLEDLLLSLRTAEREKSNLEKENKHLEKQIINIIKDKQTRDSKNSLELERNKIIQEKTVEIFNLEKNVAEKEKHVEKSEKLIEKLKKIRSIWMRGEQIPLKPIKKFHIDELELTHKNYGIRSGDIVLILDPSGGSSSTAKWLASRHVRAIIIPRGYVKRLSSLALQHLNDAEIPILEEELITYYSEQSTAERKGKIVLFEDFYIINKRYLLQRLYEEEVKYVQNKEFLRIKKHKETRESEIPIDKSSFEYLLFNYQNNRVQKRLFDLENAIDHFEDYDELDDI